MAGRNECEPFDPARDDRPGRMVSLGAGLRAPYPEPTSEAASRIGKGNRRTDTKPEVRLRSELHRRGLRFRKDLLLREGPVRVRPDVVFTGAKVAVFVDGCFWHSCPVHRSIPKSNVDYWIPKLRANEDRDRRVVVALESAGWMVLRIWEHEDPQDAADLIEGVVRSARDRPKAR